MSLITVNPELCLHDGICTQECPSKLIALNGGSRLPEAIDGAEERCIKCGHCVALCPSGALAVDGIKQEECIALNTELQLNNNQLEQLIKFRRSVRNFKDKRIDKDVLDKLIEISRYAPTGGNSQQVQWLVLNSAESVHALAEKVIVFFRKMADSNHPLSERYNINSLIKRWESGYDVIFRGAPTLIAVHTPKIYGIGTVDNTIALSYLDLAATNYGLGTCWAGFFMISALQSPDVIQYLNLPDGNICTGALMLGYPKYKFQRIPPRNKAKIIWRE